MVQQIKAIKPPSVPVRTSSRGIKKTTRSSSKTNDVPHVVRITVLGLAGLTVNNAWEKKLKSNPQYMALAKEQNGVPPHSVPFIEKLSSNDKNIIGKKNLYLTPFPQETPAPALESAITSSINALDVQLADPKDMCAVVALSRNSSTVGISGLSLPLTRSLTDKVVFNDELDTDNNVAGSSETKWNATDVEVSNAPLSDNERYVAVWPASSLDTDDDKSTSSSSTSPMAESPHQTVITFETHLHKSCKKKQDESAMSSISSASSIYAPKSFEVTVALAVPGRSFALPLGIATLAISGEECLKKGVVLKEIDLPILSLAQTRPMFGAPASEGDETSKIVSLLPKNTDSRDEEATKKSSESKVEVEATKKKKKFRFFGKKKVKEESLTKSQPSDKENDNSRDADISTVQERLAFYSKYAIDSSGDAVLRVAVEVYEKGSDQEKMAILHKQKSRLASIAALAASSSHNDANSPVSSDEQTGPAIPPRKNDKTVGTLLELQGLERTMSLESKQSSAPDVALADVSDSEQDDEGTACSSETDGDSYTECTGATDGTDSYTEYTDETCFTERSGTVNTSDTASTEGIREAKSSDDSRGITSGSDHSKAMPRSRKSTSSHQTTDDAEDEEATHVTLTYFLGRKIKVLTPNPLRVGCSGERDYESDDETFEPQSTKEDRKSSFLSWGWKSTSQHECENEVTDGLTFVSHVKNGTEDTANSSSNTKTTSPISVSELDAASNTSNSQSINSSSLVKRTLIFDDNASGSIVTGALRRASLKQSIIDVLNCRSPPLVQFDNNIQVAYSSDDDERTSPPRVIEHSNSDNLSVGTQLTDHSDLRWQKMYQSENGSKQQSRAKRFQIGLPAAFGGDGLCSSPLLALEAQNSVIDDLREADVGAYEEAMDSDSDLVSSKADFSRATELSTHGESSSCGEYSADTNLEQAKLHNLISFDSNVKEKDRYFSKNILQSNQLRDPRLK